MNELESFFGSNTINATRNNDSRDWEDIIFILCSECSWSQKDVEDAEIPFILDFFKGRHRHIKRENEANRKASKQRH